MSDVTKTVVNGAIDGAEKVADVAMTAIEEAVGLAGSTASAPITVGEKTADALLTEAKSLRAPAGW